MRLKSWRQARQPASICHKLYHAKIRNHGSSEIIIEVEIDTQYKSINLKGTRPQNMPRYSKKKEVSRSHIEEYLTKVAIVCATDENDHT